MMSETYVECLVKKKSNTGMVFLRMLTSLYFNRPYYLAGIVDWSGNGGGGLFCLFECRFGV